VYRYKYILFDAANTLIHKPELFGNMNRVLAAHGYAIPEEHLRRQHKLVSELVLFPDRTDRAFYAGFNASVLYALGIVPSEKLLDALFEACTYLPWVAFEDTAALPQIDLPKGIVSNFNTTLAPTIEGLFGPLFSAMLVSEEKALRKPDPAFYKAAIDTVGLKPAEILYIGDSVKLDIEPAAGLGMHTLLIDRDGLYPYAKNRIASFEEIHSYILTTP